MDFYTWQQYRQLLRPNRFEFSVSTWATISSIHLNSTRSLFLFLFLSIQHLIIIANKIALLYIHKMVAYIYIYVYVQKCRANTRYISSCHLHPVSLHCGEWVDNVGVFRRPLTDSPTDKQYRCKCKYICVYIYIYILGISAPKLYFVYIYIYIYVYSWDEEVVRISSCSSLVIVKAPAWIMFTVYPTVLSTGIFKHPVYFPYASLSARFIFVTFLTSIHTRVNYFLRQSFFSQNEKKIYIYIFFVSIVSE